MKVEDLIPKVVYIKLGWKRYRLQPCTLLKQVEISRYIEDFNAELVSTGKATSSLQKKVNETLICAFLLLGTNDRKRFKDCSKFIDKILSTNPDFEKIAEAVQYALYDGADSEKKKKIIEEVAAAHLKAVREHLVYSTDMIDSLASTDTP